MEPLNDTWILGHRIPEGTTIFMLLRHLATRDEHFMNGDRFDPERWLVKPEDRRGPHDHRAFVPFGAGPRFCPGRNLAMLEIRAVLAMLCGNFDVLPVDRAGVREQLAFTMFPTGLFVRMRRRQRP
ncbi:MAG: cytochrome P450 [Boseongicola sp. SB0670_bin_30]|nr:cytochrome P450 [Boseongicola sp. SB0670_bin_30]